MKFKNKDGNNLNWIIIFTCDKNCPFLSQKHGSHRDCLDSSTCKVSFGIWFLRIVGHRIIRVIFGSKRKAEGKGPCLAYYLLR